MTSEWPVYCKCGKLLGVLVGDVRAKGGCRAVLLGHYLESCAERYVDVVSGKVWVEKVRVKR